MTLSTSCDHEARVLAQNRGEDEARFVHEHLTTCASCRESVDVAAFLRKIAVMPSPHRLPEASRLWFRAQLLRRWDAERRAAAPIETMQRAERILLLVGLAVLGWMWTQAEGWLSLEGPLSPLSMVSSVLPRSAVAAIIAVVIAAAIGSAALLRDGVKD